MPPTRQSKHSVKIVETYMRGHKKNGNALVPMNIKLSPKLFDLFQFCEIRCNAHCCEWDAFDFSEHWLRRWCEFRDVQILAAACEDIERIRGMVAGYEASQKVTIDKFFSPDVSSFNKHLELIDDCLVSFIAEHH